MEDWEFKYQILYKHARVFKVFDSFKKGRELWAYGMMLTSYECAPEHVMSGLV